MAVGDLLGQAQKIHRKPELILGPLDGITPERGVVIMTSNSSLVRATGFQQDMIGDADLTNVMQGSRLEQQVNGLVIEEVAKTG